MMDAVMDEDDIYDLVMIMLVIWMDAVDYQMERLALMMIIEWNKRIWILCIFYITLCLSTIITDTQSFSPYHHQPRALCP